MIRTLQRITCSWCIIKKSRGLGPTNKRRNPNRSRILRPIPEESGIWNGIHVVTQGQHSTFSQKPMRVGGGPSAQPFRTTPAVCPIWAPAEPEGPGAAFLTDKAGLHKAYRAVLPNPCRGPRRAVFARWGGYSLAPVLTAIPQSGMAVPSPASVPVALLHSFPRAPRFRLQAQPSRSIRLPPPARLRL